MRYSRSSWRARPAGNTTSNAGSAVVLSSCDCASSRRCWQSPSSERSSRSTYSRRPLNPAGEPGSDLSNWARAAASGLMESVGGGNWATAGAASIQASAAQSHKNNNHRDKPRQQTKGQRGLEQREHPAPGFFRLVVVVDLRIRRAPTMHGPRIHLHFRGQMRLCTPVYQNGLGVRLFLVIVLGNREQVLCLDLGDQQVWAVGLGGHQAASVE